MRMGARPAQRSRRRNRGVGEVEGGVREGAAASAGRRRTDGNCILNIGNMGPCWRWEMCDGNFGITTRDRTRRGRRAPTGARAYLAKLYCHLLRAGVRAARAAQYNAIEIQGSLGQRRVGDGATTRQGRHRCAGRGRPSQLQRPSRLALCCFVLRSWIIHSALLRALCTGWASQAQLDALPPTRQENRDRARWWRLL